MYYTRELDIKRCFISLESNPVTAILAQGKWKTTLQEGFFESFSMSLPGPGKTFRSRKN